MNDRLRVDNNVNIVITCTEKVVSLNDLNSTTEETNLVGQMHLNALQLTKYKVLTSNPLFIIVALSRVILAPISQLGCVVALA
jgi:hypothetical protein